MRLFLTLSLVLLVVLIGLGSIFILQFDPNQFRPDLESYCERILGVESRLGDISIEWGFSLKLRIKFVEFRDPSKQTLLLKANQLTIRMNWIRFLQRSILIQSVSAERPEIFLFREKDGSWAWPRSMLPKAKTPDQDHGKRTPWATEFESPRVQIQEGTVHFHDESFNPPFSLDAEQVTVSVARSKSIALIQADIAASLYGAAKSNTFLTLHFDPSEDQLNFKLHYARDIFNADGQIRSVSKTPRIEIRMAWRGLDLLSIVPPERKNKPYITGQFNAEMEGVGTGWTWHSLKQSFAGKGVVEIRLGSFVNVNLLKELLRSMAELPQLKSLRRFEIPQDFISPLEGHDTPFDVLQGVLRGGQGEIEVSELRLKQPQYLVEGSGNYSFSEKTGRFNAKLVILEELSQFLLERTDALEAIKNPQGRLVIPVTYEGILPDAAVKPDMRYLVEKLRKKGSTEEEEDEEKDED